MLLNVSGQLDPIQTGALNSFWGTSRSTAQSKVYKFHGDNQPIGRPRLFAAPVPGAVVQEGRLCDSMNDIQALTSSLGNGHGWSLAVAKCRPATTTSVLYKLSKGEVL